MARNPRSRRRTPQSGSDSTQQAIRDSAQKIWLAGLGAYERAKTEGPRMFETLVEQGRTIPAARLHLLGKGPLEPLAVEAAYDLTAELPLETASAPAPVEPAAPIEAALEA